MYVYRQLEKGLWTVGFYGPGGAWEIESDWPSANQAAERVHWLNGGNMKYNASEGVYPSETSGVARL